MNPVDKKNHQKVPTVVQCLQVVTAVEGALIVHQPQDVLQEELLDCKLFSCDCKERKRPLATEIKEREKVTSWLSLNLTNSLLLLSPLLLWVRFFSHQVLESSEMEKASRVTTEQDAKYRRNRSTSSAAPERMSFSEGTLWRTSRSLESRKSVSPLRSCTSSCGDTVTCTRNVAEEEHSEFTAASSC